ncbi:isoprenoid synthase domain-containing protein [Truncatella angustata]|uniref:Terpene synthase n=1 Tax=Truncatella angustata TaxID=152316 RepID=A0A9P8RKY2_9PEZI|nr:isoprenoid synthase domain-containing protein [Truncatella angustata]KAH6645056.1 isoprenoid synthase domain-containing protein [Truncatella angustata]
MSETLTSVRREPVRLQTGQPRELRIPDLFTGVLSGEPALNPYEAKVRSESETWTKEIAQMSNSMAKILTRANFPYLISLSAPDADAEAFRMGCDWCIWAFVFDDLFDEGIMKDKTIVAAEEMIATLAIMDNTHPPVNRKQYPLRGTLPQVCEQFLAFYGLTIVHDELIASDRATATLEDDPSKMSTGLDVAISDYIDTRRQSIGSYCLFVVVEWAHGIQLPQAVIEHPSVAICERAAADLTWLVNDILSYKKDLAFGVEHNIICLFKRRGFSEQEAVGKTNNLMDERQREWKKAVSELPSWGEKVDHEVRKYLDACRDVARANLYWSFKSGRYLSPEESDRVRKAHVLDLA